jgi:hypothetical protein
MGKAVGIDRGEHAEAAPREMSEQLALVECPRGGFCSKIAASFSLMVVLSSMVGSLYYSEGDSV